MGMTYKEWNEVIKDVAKTYKKLPRIFGLSPNVVLELRRNKDKFLSIKAFSKILEQIGLSYEIIIKDSNGDEIDSKTFKEIIIRKIKNSNDTVTSALLNRDLINENNFNEEKTEDIDINENNEEHLTPILPEAKIDLSDIFADES